MNKSIGPIVGLNMSGENMGTSRYDAMSDGQLESVTGCGIKEYGIEFGKAMKVAVKAGIFWTEVSACLWL